MTILDEAAKLVDGARQEDYGTPIDNHTTTADLYNGYLARKYGRVFTLDAEDVCVLNILQKISRLANRYTRDNLVDIAGYALNIEKIKIVREQRAAHASPVVEVVESVSTPSGQAQAVR